MQLYQNSGLWLAAIIAICWYFTLIPTFLFLI
jgi:hypothetical protein